MADKPGVSLRVLPSAWKRIRGGHPWIFSNEIQPYPRDLPPGTVVDVVDPRGRWVGRGTFHPHSLIACRLLTRQPEPLDRAFFQRRLEAAEARRRQWLPGETVYRVVYSEADGLPGLMVDRYGDYLVVQFLTAGMEALTEVLLDALEAVFHPKGILARNDTRFREREGLPREVQVLRGAVPDRVEVCRHGLRLPVPLFEGQKTGLFLDQMENYPCVIPYARGARILDGFCYLGLWGLVAARHGAREVIGVDASARAVTWAEEIARLNGLEDTCRYVQSEVIPFLQSLRGGGHRLDVVILDPPSFIQSRSKIREGLRGYQRINYHAMKVLRPGGILITCSCSHLLEREAFLNVLRRAAVAAGRSCRLVEERTQSRDHPILLEIPETAYLKCLILEVR